MIPVVSYLFDLFIIEDRFWKSLSVYIPDIFLSNVLVSSIPPRLRAELF